MARKIRERGCSTASAHAFGLYPHSGKGMTDKGSRGDAAGAAVADSPEAISPSGDDLHEAGTGALTAEQAAGRAPKLSYTEWRSARDAALADQCARDAMFRPLEYSVLNWPTRPIGAGPACWGLPGSSRLPRTYSIFDKKAMGINLGRMRIRMHYWLSERKRVFGLSMGRRADRGDDHIYPVHPSRYCMDLGEDERSARHGTLPGGHVGFMWQVVLDGVSFLLEG